MPVRWEPIDWYEAPRWYDVIFDDDTAREAAFLEGLFERHGRSRGRRCLEPACGSGRLVVEMVRRGWKVTGFDLSPEMVAYSRRRLAEEGLRASVVEARMEDFRLRGRFDLAHCLVSTFKHLLDEGSALAHLTRVAAALAPGGLYVLGLHLSDYSDTQRRRERWVARRGGTRVTCNLQSWPPDRRRRVERVRSRLLVEEGDRTRRVESHFDFRTYDHRQLRTLLRTVPELEHVATSDFLYDPDYSQQLGPDSYDCVLVLRRR
jgi:SAM-dependent methyltransferase